VEWLFLDCAEVDKTIEGSGQAHTIDLSTVLQPNASGIVVGHDGPVGNGEGRVSDGIDIGNPINWIVMKTEVRGVGVALRLW